jgi:membrane-associated phospholipid phosphatase
MTLFYFVIGGTFVGFVCGYLLAWVDARKAVKDFMEKR